MKELENIVNDTSRILEDATLHEDLFGFWTEGILLVEKYQKSSRPFILLFSQPHSALVSSAMFFVSLRFQWKKSRKIFKMFDAKFELEITYKKGVLSLPNLLKNFVEDLIRNTSTTWWWAWLYSTVSTLSQLWLFSLFLISYRGT